MTRQATPAQIAYATKLRDDCALYATWAIGKGDLFYRQKREILGYATTNDFFAAVPDPDQRKAMLDSITGEMVRADAHARAEQRKSRQAELGAADIESMDRAQVSAFIDAAKAIVP